MVPAPSRPQQPLHLVVAPLCWSKLAVYDEGVAHEHWATPEPPVVALLLSIVPLCPVA
ncbi:unknown protein [Oryza sativa Japonica Group]|uniref:Uncharacterized protein n=2 Tax=Oryza sativa subsp. japonica TaxID=39947 RepID=A0A979HLN7_ORYSJ|nr:hypothetical protein EE612_002225 [Oryza sativa]BAD45052.1 unknown protein [Oryza sativa Japonica Group]BAS71868.1 Os01g0324400 [Oryza sativa Japonica Group]